MKLEVDNVKGIGKGNTIARFNLSVDGIVIRECMLMKTSKGHHFISMPSRKYEELGQTKYFQYVVFPSELKKEIDEKASNLVLDALSNVHSMFDSN